MGELAKVYDFEPRTEVTDSPRQPPQIQVYFVPEEEKRKRMRTRFMNQPRSYRDGITDSTVAAITFLLIMGLLSAVFWNLIRVLRP